LIPRPRLLLAAGGATPRVSIVIPGFGLSMIEAVAAWAARLVERGVALAPLSAAGVQ
jgi:hypothetical protein